VTLITRQRRRRMTEMLDRAETTRRSRRPPGRRPLEELSGRQQSHDR
jgi:hypothetical protein